MIEVLLRSCLASALGLLALFFSRRASASVRHLVAVAGLTATLAVTLLGFAVPPVRLPVLPAVPKIPPATVVVAPAAKVFNLPKATKRLSVEERRSLPWPLVWPLIGLGLGLRLAAGWLWLWRRLRSALPTGLQAAVPVLESDVFRTPMTAWTPRPAIILPPGWRDWPEERLQLVLQHELGHVRRGDGWSLSLRRLATVVAWPNPLVWWLARCETRLAEQATDDLVVEEGVVPWRYAQALFAIAQEGSATASLPALGMARKAEVAQRVEMILEPKTPRTLVSLRVRRAALCAALLASVPVATWALGRQAEPPAGKPSVTVEPTAIADPTAFRLRCKIVKVPRPEAPRAQGSPTEPEIGQADPANVVAAPDLFTGDGVATALKVTIEGTVHTLELKPSNLGPGACSVVVSDSIPFQGTRLGYGELWSRTPANGWVTYPIGALDGNYSGYQMVVQVMPYGRDVAARPVTGTATPEGPASVGQGGHDAPRCMVLCKVIKSKGGKMKESITADEPAVARAASTQLFASPKIYALMNSPATIQLSGPFNLELTAQVVPSRDQKYMVMLDGHLQDHGGAKQNLMVFSDLGNKQWLRLPFYGADGKFQGYELLVQLVL